MIDLHTHTNYSDGNDSLTELLINAQEKGIDILAITDHDNILVYDELSKINIKDYYQGKIVTGVEIKTTFNKIPIEILGYGIDINKFKDSKCVDPERLEIIQVKYLENYKKIGKKIGLIFDESISKIDYSKYAATTFYEMIIANPKNLEIIPELNTIKKEEFYRISSGNKKSKFYIDETIDSLDIDYVIDEIHRCGGKAFLAHLYVYKCTNYIDFLNDLIRSSKLDGIECFYSSFTDEQTKEIINIANENNLYISGGSDYHGKNKRDLMLGTGYGNLKVPKKIIDKWLKEKYYIDGRK